MSYAKTLVAVVFFVWRDVIILTIRLINQFLPESLLDTYYKTGLDGLDRPTVILFW